jgi:membrane fusion protein, multidrug efflux system
MSGSYDKTRTGGPDHRPQASRTALSPGRSGLLTVLLLGALVATPGWSATPVVVTRAEMADVIERVPVTGTVVAPRVARLSTEVAGLVERVMVDSGDRVRAGDTVVEIDHALARLRLDAATAATEQAREELADARRRLADAERLVESRGIPQTEIRSRESEARADGATLRLREAEQALERQRLERHAIKAPFDGVISRKLVESGEWIAPGDEMVELVADSDLRVELRVPQAFFPRIDATTRIDLRFDALPDREVAMRLGEIVPVSDPTARTFVLRAYLDEADLPLTPGMSASGMLRLATSRRGLTLTRDALLRHPDGRTTVWVIDEGGDGTSVVERLVRPGLAFDGRVVIEEGVTADMRVVVEGNEALLQGQTVSIAGSR